MLTKEIILVFLACLIFDITPRLLYPDQKVHSSLPRDLTVGLLGWLSKDAIKEKL